MMEIDEDNSLIDCHGTGICISHDHHRDGYGNHPWVWKCSCSNGEKFEDDDHAASRLQEIAGCSVDYGHHGTPYLTYDHEPEDIYKTLQTSEKMCEVGDEEPVEETPDQLPI